MTRFALAFVVLAGCAHGPHAEPDGTDANQTTRPQADVTCKEETPTGSMIPRRKCRSDAEREQERNATEHQILNPNSRGATGGPQ